MIPKWLKIDSQWMADYANAISGLDGIPTIVFDAMDDSNEIFATSLTSIGESGTFGASFGTLEIFEDIKYAKNVADILGINMDTELSEIDRMRTEAWPNTSVPVPSFPYVVPELPMTEDADIIMFNTDIAWCNDYISRGVGLLLKYPLSISPHQLGNILPAIPIVFERTRLAMIRRNRDDLDIINSLKLADSMWWKNIYSLTGWNVCKDIGNFFMNG